MRNYSNPLVSILMPAYQAADFIQQAIASCQAQSYRNWELCLVDDGSMDDTYDIAYALSLKDHRIKLSKQRHQGCPSTRNHCIDQSGGDIIARQDADDFQHIDRIQKQVNYLLKYRDRDIVSCGMRLAGPKGGGLENALQLSDFSGGMQIEKYLSNSGGRPVCASIVAWKDVYTRVGIFNPALSAGSDGEWNFRAIEHDMRWGYVDEALYYYRQHGQQLSNLQGQLQTDNHETARCFFGKGRR